MQTLLESEALAGSIANGGADWEEAVMIAFHRLTRLEHSEKKDGAGVDDWENQHRKFHSALLSACGMPLLRATCASLHDFSARYRRLFLATHAFDSQVPDEHRSIMEAALARDSGEATRLISLHIERTANNIIAALDASQAGMAAASA
jgi:GntR family transcriptional regulator, carbon starvation induced regulator